MWAQLILPVGNAVFSQSNVYYKKEKSRMKEGLNKKQGNTFYSKGLGMFTYKTSSCHSQGEQGPDAGFLLVHGCRCLEMGAKPSSQVGFAIWGKTGTDAMQNVGQGHG